MSLSDLSDAQRAKLTRYYWGLLPEDEAVEFARLLLRPIVCRVYGDFDLQE